MNGSGMPSSSLTCCLVGDEQGRERRGDALVAQREAEVLRHRVDRPAADDAQTVEVEVGRVHERGVDADDDDRRVLAERVREAVALLVRAHRVAEAELDVALLRRHVALLPRDEVPLAQPALLLGVADDDEPHALAVAALRCEASGVDRTVEDLVRHGVRQVPAARVGRAHRVGELHARRVCQRIAQAARTSNSVSVTGPNDVMSATSTASRPLPTTTRPTRRRLLRASNVCQAAVEVHLEPGREVHGLHGRRDVDLGDVAEDVARRDVQRPAERDRQVREVAADALSRAVGVQRGRPRVRRPRHPLEVVVDEVDDGLHPLPAGRVVAEAVPRLAAELVGEAEAAGHDEGEMLVGQRHDRGLRRARRDVVAGRVEHDLRLVDDPRRAGRDREALAAVAVQVEVAVMGCGRLPALAAHLAQAVRRRDLQHGRHRDRRLQPEGAADGEGERVRQDTRRVTVRPGHRLLELRRERQQDGLARRHELHARGHAAGLADRQLDGRPAGDVRGGREARDGELAVEEVVDAARRLRQRAERRGGRVQRLAEQDVEARAVPREAPARGVHRVDGLDVLEPGHLLPGADHLPGHRLQLVLVRRAAEHLGGEAVRPEVVDRVDDGDRVTRRLPVAEARRPDLHRVPEALQRPCGLLDDGAHAGVQLAVERRVEREHDPQPPRIGGRGGGEAGRRRQGAVGIADRGTGARVEQRGGVADGPRQPVQARQPVEPLAVGRDRHARPGGLQSDDAAAGRRHPDRARRVARRTPPGPRRWTPRPPSRRSIHPGSAPRPTG